MINASIAPLHCAAASKFNALDEMNEVQTTCHLFYEREKNNGKRYLYPAHERDRAFFARPLLRSAGPNFFPGHNAHAIHRPDR